MDVVGEIEGTEVQCELVEDHSTLMTSATSVEVVVIMQGTVVAGDLVAVVDAAGKLKLSIPIETKSIFPGLPTCCWACSFDINVVFCLWLLTAALGRYCYMLVLIKALATPQLFNNIEISC